MSDDEGDKSLDKFESMNEEISVEKSSSPSELDERRLFDLDDVELMVNPIGDVACYSDDEPE
eukprot:12474117-Ditylum_brightwellii.AAC.1